MDIYYKTQGKQVYKIIPNIFSAKKDDMFFF